MSQLELSNAFQKLKRLTSMSPCEVVHRVREKGYSQLERIGLGTAPAPNGSGFKAYLAGAPAERFYCSHRESPRLIQERVPEWVGRAAADAEKLLRHEVSLLHFDPVNLGQEIDWHRDPVTGRDWERRFWADYDPENDSAGRDSKNIHELNRHQHLPRLAKAYRWTGDERYAAEAVAQLERWIHQNPPGIGINWQSSLEIGIRTISWMWTIFLLLGSRAFDDAAAERIGDSLFSQLAHVHRYTSLFTSPNTHLIGEAAALFIGGLLFNDRKPAVAWKERGAALLIQEADRQILDDGVHSELSACYHCYTLDFYLQALTLAEQNHYLFPERVREKVGGMLNFVMHVSTPGGTIPLLGDDDGGRALGLERTNYRSFHDALSLGAVLFQRRDFKHQSGGFCEETFWLLGQKGWADYDRLESEPPAENQAVFAAAGYAIQRSGWGPLDSHLVFDMGGLGMLTGGHSHADALSLILSSEGRNLLVDPGTYVYNSAPEWRSYFRSTRAHNTVAIDGRDQAEAPGTFLWKTALRTRMISDVSFPPNYLEAEQDGYQRLQQGVTHRRRLLYIPGEYWIVVDDFRGSGRHTFDFHYHFGADLEARLLRPRETDVEIRAENAGLFLGIYGSTEMTAELLCGKTVPVEGWISSGYGNRQSSDVLRASLTGCLGNLGEDPETPAAMTFLIPNSSAAEVTRLNVDRGNAIACTYNHGAFRDVVVFSTGSSEVHAAGLRMQGEFFWTRMEGNVIRKAVAIRGRLQQESSVWEERVCAPSAAL
jgi:hypothetical protein